MNNWKRYNPIGEEEKNAVMEVLDSGSLSSFIGAWGEDFSGGEQVKKFESDICQYFNCTHSVTFNSLTSGLIAAMGAIGIQPGDEVIVSPWTMSATATAILVWGGIPVFADIEDTFYGLCPNSLREKIGPRTKAIVVTDIFGHGAKLDEICDIAKANSLRVIEDVAQAPGVKFKEKFCGTWADIGGFSLNYHKHIHTGEGGFCITEDENLALRMKLIRNHAEASIVGSGVTDLTNMIGYNFRMGEMEAAIGRQQLKKLPLLLKNNIFKAEKINAILNKETDFCIAAVEVKSNHAYYVLPLKLSGTSEIRENWVNRLNEIGIPGIIKGYANIHRLPIYTQKVAFGRGYPWNMHEGEVEYGLGTAPMAESLQDNNFVGFLVSMYDLSESQCEYIANTMVETWNQLK